VKQSGGYVELDTKLGNGTTFSILLPVAEALRTSHRDPRSEAGAEEGGNENILLVEDDELVRTHARNQLERLGYEVVEASNALQALEILDQRDDIDLLFTDIVMPGGMSGRELGERGLARHPSLRVLYTSGYTRDEFSESGAPHLGASLLPKPYTNRDLAERIRNALDEVPEL
jgi:CheY-like chemotaxis protein